MMPPYNGNELLSNYNYGIGLAVESMQRHTTDEGWQIFAGLQHAGYELAGARLTINETDVRQILSRNPGIVVVQDKREWDTRPHDFRDTSARFTNIEALRERDDIFKVTILKDSHQRPDYHKQSADEMGVHAWIVYYNPKKVAQLAPYVRPEHLIRTYHSIDPKVIPKLTPFRSKALLSGAVSNAYPLRQRLAKYYKNLGGSVDYLKHPGYHMRGTATPNFLKLLNNYKVAICTASVYDYALRKLIEATACGCKVITNLSEEDRLPEIDGNLIRVPSDCTNTLLIAKLEEAYQTYDFKKQCEYAERATTYYDYRAVGERLADDIQKMRDTYNG